MIKYLFVQIYYLEGNEKLVVMKFHVSLNPTETGVLMTNSFVNDPHFAIVLTRKYL